MTVRSTRRRCAFLTMQATQGFFIYDQLTYPPLAALGWQVDEIVWDDTGVDWSNYEAVVIRSTWDYQSKPGEFFETLSRIESTGTKLLNPSEVCRWNLQKTYLRDLAERGVPIIPSHWPDRLDREVIKESFKEFGGTKLVAKPLIGANANDTYVITDRPNDHANQIALEVFQNRPLILQPFIDSICESGEYSLFYFGGRYSHAILKTPQCGDFRVQEEHGGIIHAIDPQQDLLEISQQAIQAIDQELLYARVDVVRLSDGTPALIELELIEPSLYFSYDAQSPRRFAEAFERIAGASENQPKL